MAGESPTTGEEEFGDGSAAGESEGVVGESGGVVGESGGATGESESVAGDADVRTWIAAGIPILLLAVAVALVVAVPPFGGVQSGAPLPDVTVTHATLPEQGTVNLHVVNDGPGSVTVEQVLVDDAYWSFSMRGASEDGRAARTLGPLESATVQIPYHWNPGWDLDVTLVLASGATVHHTVVAPQETPRVGADLLGTLAVVGLFVGVIPVVLGMLWYPAMRKLPRRWLHAVLAFAGGVLAFLAFDAGFEALAVARQVPGAYAGQLLVVVGALGTLLVIQAVSEHLGGDHLSPLGLAYLVALSIGLHNLAEGLAIGGAVALGRASLGAFLVIGFMVHNVTEGPAVVAPLARERRPKLRHFAAMGLLAGAPVILGGWIGSVALGPTPGALALAIGVGAILQVEWEMAGLIRRDGDLATVLTIGGFLVGLAVMYATDLLVAL